MHSATHQTIATIWRLERAKIVAKVAQMVRDVGLAEDLAQDALVAALEHWPRDGVPHNGAACLMTKAKLRALDRLLIRRGLVGLERAQALCAASGRALGSYALQAAIAACHARATQPEQTDWPRIAGLYDALAQLAPSPVVELNRAVAVSMAFGPAAGLEIIDTLLADKSLQHYQWLPSVRGDLLAKLGRNSEAKVEFERAAGLAGNARERALLLGRAGDLVDSGK